MSEGIQTAPHVLAQPAVSSPGPAFSHPAVALCCQAYMRSFKAAKTKGKGQVFAELDGEQAYRNFMPLLSGYENICDFIACTAHGMLIGTIAGPAGARLLYAAQVANGTLRHQSAKRKATTD